MRMGDRKKSADLKRKHLKLNFKKFREQFDGFKDDRLIFCNTYDVLMEALNVMETVDNNLIWVAFNDKYKEEFEILEEIGERFKDRDRDKQRDFESYTDEIESYR